MEERSGSTRLGLFIDNGGGGTVCWLLSWLSSVCVYDELFAGDCKSINLIQYKKLLLCRFYF